MVSWIVSPEDIRPLSELADSLGDDVSRLDDAISALSYDCVVRRECNGCTMTPCSVDCVCLTDDTTYFIEYKREVDKAMDEIHRGYECKCRETLLIYDRFIRHDPERRRVLERAATWAWVGGVSPWAAFSSWLTRWSSAVMR